MENRRTLSAILAQTMHALEELQRINLSTVNRCCLAFTLLCGIALVVDLVLVLAEGGSYQSVRHTAGFIAIGLALLWYVRLYRNALRLITQASEELIERYAPSGWAEQERQKLLSSLPYERMAKRYALFGMEAMVTTLKKSLESGLAHSKSKRHDSKA